MYVYNVSNIDTPFASVDYCRARCLMVCSGHEARTYAHRSGYISTYIHVSMSKY